MGGYSSPQEAALIPLGAMWPWPYVLGGDFSSAPCRKALNLGICRARIWGRAAPTFMIPGRYLDSQVRISGFDPL